MTLTIRQALDRGYVAVLVVDETDRLPYTAPPIPREEHALTCGCPDCLLRRSLDRRGVA